MCTHMYECYVRVNIHNDGVILSEAAVSNTGQKKKRRATNS